MPIYEFSCPKCTHEFEELLSFSQYDDKVKTVECPLCKELAVRRFDTAPHGSVVGNTVGSLADKNTKKLGGYVGEQEAKRKEKLPKRKEPWYGRLPSDKAKKILSGDKKAAEKYIRTGE